MAVLEASMTSKARENMKKTPKNDNKQVKKVLVVAQELKLARVLAGNNKTARDRALKSLRKWFQNRATTIPFTENDFLRLWKGLFYSMWMSDKPLIQEECAENISKLLHTLPLDTSLLFYKCGMTVLMNEWFGIDQLRLDKFLMFVRRLLRQALFVLKNENWKRDVIVKFTNCLSETILNTQLEKPLGLLMHFSEIYLEELAKVCEGELPPHLLTEFLSPFIKELASCQDSRIINHIRKHVFIYLIQQSDLGLEYREKYNAWRSLGFPGSIDAMEKVEVSEEESGGEDEEEREEGEERVYDPRAGKVDVSLSPLKFHPKAVSKALNECKFGKNTNLKSRKCLSELAEHFRKMASGVYPLGVKKLKLAKDDYDTNIRKAVNRLVKFENKIKGKKNKKRKNHQEKEIELRGGKKIKLEGGLEEKIREELANKVKKKRKLNDTTEVPPQKQKKNNTSEAPPQKLNKNEQRPWLEIESIFQRNSGTWLVTKTVQQEPQSKPDVEMKTAKENSVAKESSASITKSLQLLNPFANAAAKKVKINTKLNRSQDMQEHHAQILSSPGIPYDANKKPAKPLLKSNQIGSPVNPFYGFE